MNETAILSNGRWHLFVARLPLGKMRYRLSGAWVPEIAESTIRGVTVPGVPEQKPVEAVVITDSEDEAPTFPGVLEHPFTEEEIRANLKEVL